MRRATIMEDVRPTAKWANRILRPLTSIYNRLRKHQEIVLMVANGDKNKERPGAQLAQLGTPSRRTEAEDGYLDTDGDGDDPAWVPGQSVRRRIRHKYSLRGEEGKVSSRRRIRPSMYSPDAQPTLPGAVEIATPLITGRLLKRPHFSESQAFNDCLASRGCSDTKNDRKPTRVNDNKSFAYKGSWKEALDMSGDAGLVDIARFLDQIFLKFLINTSANSAILRKAPGARSLLSMAARRLPEFMALEQRLQDEDDDACDIDMCDAYFSELEAHYAPSGNGWQPLREAVRAQGIYLVSEMLHKKWVPEPVACRLLEPCMNHSHFDAFEALLSKVLSTVESYEHPASFDSVYPSLTPHAPLTLLHQYYSSSLNRQSFCFNELSRLLSRGILPPEWMVTKSWKKCVDAAIVSLSTGDEDSLAATDFIENVVLSASGSYLDSSQMVTANLLNPVRQKGTCSSSANTYFLGDHVQLCPIPIQDALSNLVSSLIALLCGMYIVRSCPPAAGDSDHTMPRTDIVGSLATSIRRTIELSPPITDADVPAFQSLRRGFVLLAQCILSCEEIFPSTPVVPVDAGVTQNTEVFFLHVAARSSVVKELAVLVQQVIYCCERVNVCPRKRTSEAVRAKISRLLDVSATPGLSTFLGKVAVEAAMKLAERTLEPEDHIWAMEVQERVVSSQHNLRKNPERANEEDNFENKTEFYRWEDMISEWVTSTPIPKRRVPRLTCFSKQSVSRQRLPAGLCSTPTSQSSVSCSEHSDNLCSSVTSSVASSSHKRPLVTIELPQRPIKRMRSLAVEVTGHESSSTFKSTILTHLESISNSTSSPEIDTERSTRPDLREMKQAADNLNCEIDCREVVQPSKTTIEVLINKKTTSIHTPPVRDSGRSYSDYHPSEQRELPRKRSANSPPTRLVTAIRPGWTHMPYLQHDDESDDELSYL